MAESTTTEEPQSFILNIVYEIIQSPINLILVSVISFLVYKIVKGRTNVVNTTYEAPKELPRLRRDFRVEELKPYDGNVSEGNPDGRILVAVNFNVYDVTKGKRFYGPGGPYATFGGKDASRGLATFSVTSSDKLEWDDLSDLNQMEMESVKEWEMQFKEKYILVGRLIKKGEVSTNYSDEEESEDNKKDE